VNENDKGKIKISIRLLQIIFWCLLGNNTIWIVLFFVILFIRFFICCNFSLKEMNLSPANYHKIKDLQSERDINILHGGSGGYQRFTVSFIEKVWRAPQFIKWERY
jgi:hypothetical protein